jgi:triacylglycerol lipase
VGGNTRHVGLLPLPHVPPLWREGLVGLEAARLLASPVWRGHGIERGQGEGVLLIPGFLAGDGSLALVHQWLRDLGYRTKSTGIRANISCSADACRRLERKLESLNERTGQRAVIIGQSRGGILGKAIAAHRPDLVRGVVALGSPILQQLSVHPLVLSQIALVATLGTGRVAGCFTHECLRGECCREFRDALHGPFPDDVGFVSVFSRRDGIVNWRACVDPAADEHVEVNATHCGMCVHAPTYKVVANALARFREGDAWPGAWFAQAA